MANHPAKTGPLLRVALLSIAAVAVGIASWIAGEYVAQRRAEANVIDPHEQSRRTLERQRDYFRVGSVFPNVVLMDPLDSSVTTLYEAVPNGGLIAYVSPNCPHCEELASTLRETMHYIDQGKPVIFIGTGYEESLREWAEAGVLPGPLLWDHSEFIRLGGASINIPAIAYLDEFHEVRANNTGGWTMSDYANMLEQ